MARQRQKLQALFGAVLLIGVGPISGVTAGLGGIGVAAAGNHAGNTGTTPIDAGAGNQPTDSGVSNVSWNNSTAPETDELEALGQRANDSRPYAVVGDQQPTDPDGDGQYEDINGDGTVNIVDVDALQRHLSSTAVGANWSAYDFTGDNRTDVGDVQWLYTVALGMSVNDSDSDGLPNEYERTVTGTDPQDPDSDGDGTIDGEEDWDTDGLTAYREYQLDTDPLVADTDGDGLDDGLEQFRSELDPTNNDTDDDGVLDGQEDFDGDNLTAVNETEQGTYIGANDTDGDDLQDGAEVHEYGTNATLYDTDDDGLDDGAEIRLGTDPTDPDTDDDGIFDGNETFTTRTANESLNVSLSLTGEGDIANGTTIAPQDQQRFNSSRVDNMSRSPVVELESVQNFSSANVTIGYNETGIENESRDVAVFTFDPELGIFVPLNSTVDTANNTVTAETDHFSTFAVYDIDTWETTYDAEEPVRETDDDGIVPVDVTLVMDTSGSMDGDVDLRNQAGQQFVSGLLDVDRAAVVDFDNDATVAQELTSDFSAVNATLDSLGADGGTAIGDGVSAANSHFESQSNDSRAQVMILLTDGVGSGGTFEAETAAERNTTIYTIGFDNADEDKLQEIANITGGEYNYVANSSNLPQVFSRVANNTTEITDSDGDGLSDELEQEGLVLGGPGGGTIQTNPNVSDTDGDNLTDGEEIGRYRNLTFHTRQTTQNVSFYDWESDPTEVDTDGDGLSDYNETHGWEIPVNNTSSNELYQWAGPDEVIVDGTVTFTSNPRAVDSDGDELDDDVEIEETYTDPEATTTYEITEEHEDFLLEVYNSDIETAPILTRTDRSLSEIIQFGLNDRRDDFDFVMLDSDEASGADRLTFRAMDGTTRTDVWFGNQEEVAFETDPWDPDTDDDGLTDGWENDGIPNYEASSPYLNDSFEGTDMLDADTDGDGYWDGWIGVHGVGYTDNVVLYREHLQSGDGIEGDEIVTEQAQYHEVTEAPSAMGADIDGDGDDEHSNVHIGERHWQEVDGSESGDPMRDSVTPSPSLDVEVDYHESYDPTLVNSTSDVSDVYRLYGIDVSYNIDEGVSTTELREISNARTSPTPPTAPHVSAEANHIEADFHDTSDTVYLFLSPSGEGQWESIGGVASSGGNGFPPLRNFGMFVFEDDITSSTPEIEHQSTVAHETGHILAIGRNDDVTGVGRIWDEVYSGSSDDDTPEDLIVVAGSTGNNYTTEFWSIMRSGYGSTQVDMPPSSTHQGTIRFSVEELLTVETEDTSAEAHSRWST